MADTLREYLIALGFHVDENGWKGFNAKIQQSGKNVAALGAQTVATAAEIGVAVEKVAKHYEELYYVSQRTGQSAAFLKSNEFGMRQIGLSADQARSAVEGMAASMRLNPGITDLAKRWGVTTPVDVVDKLKSSGTQYFVAQRMAEQLFGIDERTFQHMWNNMEKLKREQETSRQRMLNAGLDPKKLSDDSTAFMTQLRGLGEELSILEDKTISVIIGPATTVVTFMKDAVHEINRMNAALGGTIGILLGLGGAWGIAKVGLGLGARLLGIGGGAAAGARSLGVGSMGMRLLGPVGAFAWGMGLGGEAQGATMPGGAGMAHPSDRAGSTESAIAFYMGKGWTREQAAGIVANLHSESRLNPSAVGDGGQAYGIAQWHPDRQAKFARWAGKSIRDASLAEQMEFVHHELTQGDERMAGRALKNAGNARDAGSIVSRSYERPADVMGEAVKRGALADKISGGDTNVTSTITVTGVSDPDKAARAVDENNKRVMANVVRQGQKAIQ